MVVLTFIGLMNVSKAIAQGPYREPFFAYSFAPFAPQPGYFFNNYNNYNNYNTNYNNPPSDYGGAYPPWAQFPWTPGPAYTPPGVLEGPMEGYGASSSGYYPSPPQDWSLYWPIPEDSTGPMLIPIWEPYDFNPPPPPPYQPHGEPGESGGWNTGRSGSNWTEGGSFYGSYGHYTTPLNNPYL